jgi:hypothetical protein
MPLINFLGLIVKLTLVFGDCDIGTHTLTGFVWNKVGISVFTCLVQQAALKTAAWFCISFVVP